jgi:hypothetical protein
MADTDLYTYGATIAGDHLYWSSSQHAWVGLSEATVYTDSERRSLVRDPSRARADITCHRTGVSEFVPAVGRFEQLPESMASFGLTALVAGYSDRIKDGRTKTGILTHLCGEVVELHHEVHPINNEPGPDGIFGEAIDVMACCFDLIRKERPTATMLELEQEVFTYMRLKLDKWESKAGK